MKFIGAAGYEMETPITHDMEDFSIHNPSGKGRKDGDVMSLEEWIDKHQGEAYTVALRFNAVNADDLRELMKGKVLLSVELAEAGMQALRNDAIHHRGRGMHIAAQQCDEDAQGIERALQPNA